MRLLNVLAISFTPKPGRVGAELNPYPGKEGATTWNACGRVPFLPAHAPWREWAHDQHAQPAMPGCGHGSPDRALTGPRQHGNDLVELPEAAGPAMAEQQGDCARLVGALMDEVQLRMQSVYLGTYAF